MSSTLQMFYSLKVSLSLTVNHIYVYKHLKIDLVIKPQYSIILNLFHVVGKKHSRSNYFSESHTAVFDCGPWVKVYFFHAIMWTQQGLKSLDLQSHLKSFCTENKRSRATAWMTNSLLLPSASHLFLMHNLTHNARNKTYCHRSVSVIVWSDRCLIKRCWCIWFRHTCNTIFQPYSVYKVCQFDKNSLFFWLSSQICWSLEFSEFPQLLCHSLDWW